MKQRLIKNIKPIGCVALKSTSFKAIFSTCTLDKGSIKAFIRDRNEEGKSNWNDQFSDRLIEDLIIVEDNEIVSI